MSTQITPLVEPVNSRFKTVPLGEVLAVDGRSVAPGQLVDGTTYIGLESIGQAGVLDESVTVQANELKSAKFAFDSRHVLYGKLRPNLGKVARPTRQGVCSTDIYPLLPGPHLDRDYLAHFLLRPETIAKAASRTAGVNLPRISSAVLKSFEIPLPPIPEQRRIAAILDQADVLRAKRRYAAELLDDLADAVFSDTFMSKGDGERFPKVMLRDLGRVVTGSTPPGSSPQMFGGTLPFITPGDLEVEGEPRRYLSDIGARGAKVVGAGALLVCCIGTVGKIGIASREVAFNQQINAVEWGAAILGSYGMYAAQSIRRFIVAAASSTTIPIVNKTNFEKLRIPVPPIDKQQAFEKHIAEVRVAAERHRSHLAKLDELFASLQHRAFTGQL